MLPGNKPILVASEASTVGTMTSIFDISPFFSKDKPAVKAKRDFPTPAGASHMFNLTFKSCKCFKKVFCFWFLHFTFSL